MKEVKVTGSNGFVGMRLTERLANFQPIPHEEISKKNLGPFDTFFFLSTYGNMSGHNDDLKTIRANVLDLVDVIEQTNLTNLKSFVYMSSSSVNRKIQTIYSRTKRASEEILLALMDKYKAPICIIRPFSITGVGEQKEHLIPTLIRSCLLGEVMPFVPYAKHDFIDVDDVIDGVLSLSTNSARGIYELGSGVQYSNQEVREIVEKVTGKKANVSIVPNLREYDSEEWVSRNFKARMYGWLPKKTLEQSISEMVTEHLLTNGKN